MTRHLLTAIIAFLAVLAFGFLTPLLDPPPEPATDLAAAFLVQSECTTPDGAPLPGILPFETACQAHRPATPGALTYRRLDWSGVQASDAVSLPDGRVAQTFDFGDPPRAFGRLDRNLGDGGDLITLTPRGATITHTEDGGAGRQWWRDAACPEGAGWLLFAGRPGETWTVRDGRLGMARDGSACPTVLSPVHTRWRRLSYPLPWTDNAGAAGVLHLDSILSEHFAGGPPEAADHMERFLFGHRLGKVMWERWEHSDRTRRAPEEMAQAVAAMEQDGRCPIQAQPPAPGWRRADCRVWMRFDRAGGHSLNWP